MCTALAKVVSIMDDIKKLCTNGDETSQESYMTLTAFAQTAEEKLTTEFNVVSCPAPSNAKSEKGSGQTCIGPVSQRNVQ